MWRLWVGKCVFWPVQPEMGPLIAAGRDSPEELSRAVGGEVVWSQLALGLVLGVSPGHSRGARKAVSETRGSGVAGRHSHHRLGYSRFRVPHRRPSALTLVLKGLVTASHS